MNSLLDQKQIPDYVRDFSNKFFGLIQDKPLAQQKQALKSLVKIIKKFYKNTTAKQIFLLGFKQSTVYSRKLNYLIKLLQKGNLNKIKTFVIRWHSKTNLVEELNRMMTTLVIYALDHGYRHHIHFLLKLIRNDDKKLRSLCFNSETQANEFLDRLTKMDNELGENLTAVLLKRMPINLIYSRLISIVTTKHKLSRDEIRRFREIYLRLIPVVEKKKGFLKMLKDLAINSELKHQYILEDLSARA